MNERGWGAIYGETADPERKGTESACCEAILQSSWKRLGLTDESSFEAGSTSGAQRPINKAPFEAPPVCPALGSCGTAPLTLSLGLLTSSAKCGSWFRCSLRFLLAPCFLFLTHQLVN